MINVYNLTNEQKGLINLSGKYIIAKDKSIADVLVMYNKDISQLEITNQLFSIVFLDEPDDDTLSYLLNKGILSFASGKDDTLEHVINFCENGNLSGSLNFDDLDMGNNDYVRLAFVVKDMMDPITEIMDMLTGLNIPTTKMSAKRRDDNISYVLLETTKKDVPTLSFKNEKGSHILRYLKID